MTSSLCHVSSFFCKLWAPRVTVQTYVREKKDKVKR